MAASDTPHPSKQATESCQVTDPDLVTDSDLITDSRQVTVARTGHADDDIPANEAPVASVAAGRKHVLTISLEEYFQVASFYRLISPEQWGRFESRLEVGATKALGLLSRFNIKATFFVLGWIAEKWPELVRRIADEGHEIADRGFYHRSFHDMSPEAFRDDLARSRQALENASGTRVHGFRLSDGWLGPDDLWVLDVLQEEGYAYDSSLLPAGRKFRKTPWRRVPHEHTTSSGTIWEFPPSTTTFCGIGIPIAGGNYLRQSPDWLMRRAVRKWTQRNDAPLVMYFHTWELDPDQPRVRAAGPLTSLRHYRHLGKSQATLEGYFADYEFGSIAEALGLPKQQIDRAVQRDHARAEADGRAAAISIPPTAAAASTGRERVPLTLVVPCYNEVKSLPFLQNTLVSVEADLADRYQLHYVFVDDCSSDETWQMLEQQYGSSDRCRLIRHAANLGVAAAIQTGIRAAETEIVCSADCDCSYDPHRLQEMVPLLEDDVDMVTASPYHPQGGVRNVPRWRLFVSRSLSFLYRRILPQKLSTYTSCFRVYRRSSVATIEVRSGGFTGVAELLGRLAISGGKIVEFPTVLKVRLFGESKMKMLRTMCGHLLLLTRLSLLRLTRSGMNQKTARPIRDRDTASR